MINNNACSIKDDKSLSREQAFELLKSLSKDNLLDQLYIDHFNNLKIITNNGR